jgi:hypothetical protein
VPARSSSAIASREMIVKPLGPSARLRLWVDAASSEVRLAAQVRHADLAPSRPAVLSGDHHAELIMGDVDHLESMQHIAALDERNVARSTAELVQGTRRVDDLQLRVDVRRERAELQQPAGQQKLTDRVTGTQPKAGVGALAAVGSHPGDLVKLGERPLDRWVQRGAERRWGHAEAAAVEHPRAQTALE